MTSVNELNAYNRGLKQGRGEGYDLGHTAGTTETYRKAMGVRWMKLIIAGLVGFMLAVAVEAQAQTAQTTLTVLEPTQVTAEVPCNPINCPTSTQTANSTAQTVENESLLSRIWGAILKVLM